MDDTGKIVLRKRLSRHDLVQDHAAFSEMT
jgi:hypothetical protein